MTCCDNPIEWAKEHPCLATAAIVTTAGLPVVGYLGYRLVKVIIGAVSSLIQKIGECFNKKNDAPLKENSENQGDKNLTGRVRGSIDTIFRKKKLKSVKVLYKGEIEGIKKIEKTLNRQLAQKSIKVQTPGEDEAADIILSFFASNERLAWPNPALACNDSLKKEQQKAAEVAIVYLRICGSDSEASGESRILSTESYTSDDNVTYSPYEILVSSEDFSARKNDWNAQQERALVDRIASHAS